LAETTYVLGDIAEITVSFKVNGVATDPDTVSAVVKKPDGTTATSTTPTVVKTGTGTYYLDITTDQVGEWGFKWVGTGAAADVGQGVFYVAPDVTAATRDYAYIASVKSMLELDGVSFADVDIVRAIGAASRVIEKTCRRKFWADTVDEDRYYSPSDQQAQEIDDLISLTALATDPTGDGSFATSWATTDYVLEPLNAAADGLPYTRICAHPRGRYLFPVSYPKSVKVTGKFGWSAVPSEVTEAMLILAPRLAKRAREAPFGIIGGDSGVIVAKITKTDPDVYTLLAPLVRHRVAVA